MSRKPKMSEEIEIQLESANGPRVIASSFHGVETILGELAERAPGWSVLTDNWSNGVALTGGRVAYPLTNLERAWHAHRDEVISCAIAVANDPNMPRLRDLRIAIRDMRIAEARFVRGGDEYAKVPNEL